MLIASRLLLVVESQILINRNTAVVVDSELIRLFRRLMEVSLDGISWFMKNKNSATWVKMKQLISSKFIQL